MRGNCELGGSATPGASDASVMNVRPFNGSWTTCSCSTTVPRLAVSARNAVASAVTVTSSRTSPIVNSKSRRAVSPVAMRIPSRRIALKPGITTSTRYRPGGRLGAAYTPLFVVTTTRCWFVASLASVTVTPATGAPARSLIAPVTSAPATCASTSDGVAAIAAAATSHQPDTQTLTRRIRTPLPHKRGWHCTSRRTVDQIGLNRLNTED